MYFIFMTSEFACKGKQSFFNRTFRQMVGMPPSAYRAKMSAEDKEKVSSL